MTGVPPRRRAPGELPAGLMRTEDADPRSPMARVSDLLGWKPYVRKEDPEPPAVLAARERWRRRAAELAGEEPPP